MSQSPKQDDISKIPNFGCVFDTKFDNQIKQSILNGEIEAYPFADLITRSQYDQEWMKADIQQFLQHLKQIDKQQLHKTIDALNCVPFANLDFINKFSQNQDLIQLTKETLDIIKTASNDK